MLMDGWNNTSLPLTCHTAEGNSTASIGEASLGKGIKDKSSKDKTSSHKSKKERKRKPEEKIVEETKKSQTPPKRPRSQPGSADESQEREKEAKKETKAVKNRAKTPDKEEKKEETKEENTKKEKRHSERQSDKNKSEKSEEKKSKHHHKHKSKDKNKDKEHAKDGDSAVEGGEKTKHKSKHKHHKEKKEKHKKEEAALAAQAAQVAAATAAATAAAAQAAAAAAASAVVTSAVSTAPSAVVKQSDTTTVTPPTSNAATKVAVSREPTCTKTNTDRMPLLNTSSSSETSLTPSFPPRPRLNIPVVPSVATVANIVRDTAATLERVIVNELKKTDNIPPDNGKIILSDSDRRSRTSPSGVLDANRRYPTHITATSSVTVPSTTAAAAIYAPSSSASSLHLSSVSNFTTATTTTVTSSIPPSSSSTLSVAPSLSSSSHWASPVPNPIQVISRTTNAISPLAPGSKPPVVTVSGIVKSEDIRRTLPITSEGVEGHKPKEREKESVPLPRPEPVHIGSVDKDKYSHLREPIVNDLEKREHISRDSERGKDSRERYTEERPPLAFALKEPIQVYRDPNLTDTEVIHVNSVQHQLAYQHHQRAVADPSPTHPQLSAAAGGASQHSTHHPTSTLAAGGLASGPSAFVPSAAVAGRIPSHPALARLPMFSPHVQALYQQHPLAQAAGHLPATYPAHLAVLNQHDLAARQHIAGLLHQESVARLHNHPGVFAQLHNAAGVAAALQGMHPGMSTAQLQQLWQQQAAASGMPIPPTWILQQHHEELERQHLHQQQQASEKSPSVAHAAVALNQAHHEKPRTPQTPQPASASSAHSQRDLSSSSSRESSVRHYAEFPPSDAQAAVQRHFQESLRKLQLPYSFSTSPASGSGSITAGTAIPKTEPGQPKDQLDRQSKERIEAEERLRKEREDKELEWVRLQKEKQQHLQHREMDIRLQAEKVGSMSHLERERYNKLHSNDSRSREEALYRHQQDVHRRHLENEQLRQLNKDRHGVSVKQEPGLDSLGRGGESVHGFQMYQRMHYGNMGAYDDKHRPGAVARTEHGKQPSQMKDSLIGYQPFGHAVAGERKEHVKIERTEPHRPVAVPALAGKPRKDMPSPPPLIHREKATDPHTSVIQGRRDGHSMHPATTIALGAQPHSVVASQAGKLPHEVDTRTANENPHNVPVIVQHGAGIGHPPPLHMRLSPGSTRQHTSPSGGAPPQQISPVDMHKKMQPLTTAPTHSSHQPMYTMSYTSPTASTTSTQHSLLLTALRPGEGGPTDSQNPGKRKPVELSPDPNRKKSKKSELPNSNSNNKPMGRFTYGDYYQHFVKDSRNSQITGGTATEAMGRDAAQGGIKQENVELKIEKVDQYKKMSVDPSAPGAMLSSDGVMPPRFNTNGALSDSDSTRSCSPKGSESSERSAKTGSPNRPGGYVNLKKKWLIQHSTDKQATVPLSGDKLANSSTALDLKSGLTSQDSAESRLSQSLPNGHLQRGSFNPLIKSEKGPSSVTLADIPKSIPDHVYDFDNSSTCSDSSTTSHKKQKKESKRKKHKHKRSHDESKHHKDKHKGEKRACLDMEGAKALSKDKEVRLTEDGRLPTPGAQLQSLVDMMNVKPPKKMILTRGRKESKDVLNVSRALVKPSIQKLKKTGEPFLQDGACCEVTPNLMKCRECRMKPSSKQSKMNIFCRFYAFRRLRYSKNGNLTIAGFSEPDQCEQEDLAPWLPFPPDPADTKCLDVGTSRYILEKVGDQFCQLVGQEEEAKSWNPSNGQNKIAWKRAVTGVREMCDTCDTTLFNIHWTCQKCGFVVCLDCYRTRKTGTAKVPKDKQSWLRCIKEQPHMPENLMLTQIIPGSALWDVGRLVHTLRAQLGIQSACKCKWSDQRRQSTPTSESQEQPPAVNGVSPTMMKENNPLATAGVDRKDTKSPGSDSNKEVKLTSFPSSNSSPLNLLADVASTQSDAEHTPDSTKYSYDQQTLPDTKAATLTTDTPSDVDPTNRSSTLRELLTKTAGKLGRPTTTGLDGSSFLTAFLPHRSENANKKQFGTMTSTFEDIIATVVEQNIAAPTMKHERTTNMINRPGRNQCQQTMDLMFNNPSLKAMNASAVRHTLTETSVLYPDVPHSWLQDGRLLRLHDPKHKGNFRIFQNQWLRGEPVIVSNLHKTLNPEIWKPEWFGKTFGHIKNDLVNCLTGLLIQGHEMKDFWDGFGDLSNRLVSEQGEAMSMKLKDWPPTEDFAETLPEHFQDLMLNLPLPEYSRRDGRLNLSSRLPDFFVKPDLGPKMYNAYGNCQHPTQGTTNLHLDISDAVNVMVHVSIPKCDPESTDVTEEDLEQAGIKIVDEACTDEQTRRRIRDGKEKPGALWHIFRAEDADKIRELLNTVARERGEDIADDHDPIHDQSWYLDKELLERLHKEHNVQGWAIAQCHGDAVFIPAGAPHQVQNLQSCIKVAEDFVSPEHISHCFDLTQEFRRLSDTHSNHEDKLQIKNMIYHAVKDAAGVLVSQEIPSPNAVSQ